MITKITNLFDKSLHYLGKNYESVFALNIGAMDGVTFDEMIGYSKKYNFNVLYVEPVPYLFESLRKNIGDDNSLFENSAITDFDGEVKMIVINRKSIDDGLVINYFSGMSAVCPPRNGLELEKNKEIVDNYGEYITVPSITLKSLLQKHKVDKINIFKIDAEGYDFKIFKQLDLKSYSPEIIRIEWFNLDEYERTELLKILDDNNYSYEFSIMDIIAVREDIINFI